MPLLGRVCAAALVVCPIVLAVPAGAVSRLDGFERSTPTAPPSHDFSQTDGVPHATSLLSGSGVVGAVEAYSQHADSPEDMLSSPIVPLLSGGHALHPFRGKQARSEVPLPTGFSLFGAAILTLGLVGFVTGSQRRPALELGGHADRGPLHADKGPPAGFRIEVTGAQGRLVRHTSSARAAIDMIADLLNEGWDLVRISDREGLPVDYGDVIQAWRAERPGW